MTSAAKFQLGLLFAAMVVVGSGWSWHGSASDELEGRTPAQQAETITDEAKEDALARADEPLGVARDKTLSSQRPESDKSRVPHPITPLHEAMAERRELMGALVAAIEDKQHEKARSLLRQADELAQAEPESSNFGATVRGYRLILDCLAARNPETSGPMARSRQASEPQELPGELLDASRKYLAEQRLPPRREVRRVCLENRPFSRRT